MEALQCAQKGQLWGLALVLASQLGDQVIAVAHNFSLAVSLIWLTVLS